VIDLWAGSLRIQCSVISTFLLLVSCPKDDGDEVCLRNVCLFAPWQGAVRRRRFHPLQSPWKLRHMHTIIVTIQGVHQCRAPRLLNFVRLRVMLVCASSELNSLRIRSTVA